mmetsp:Transcript_56499/g.126219  ORF Transcript_56499/g.126219 Transcript_56499/m.126219 type:complete len:174 (-) Transcript_56499:1-522(-)
MTTCGHAAEHREAPRVSARAWDRVTSGSLCLLCGLKPSPWGGVQASSVTHSTNRHIEPRSLEYHSPSSVRPVIGFVGHHSSIVLSSAEPAHSLPLLLLPLLLVRTADSRSLCSFRLRFLRSFAPLRSSDFFRPSLLAFLCFFRLFVFRCAFSSRLLFFLACRSSDASLTGSTL